MERMMVDKMEKMKAPSSVVGPDCWGRAPTAVVSQEKFNQLVGPDPMAPDTSTPGNWNQDRDGDKDSQIPRWDGRGDPIGECMAGVGECPDPLSAGIASHIVTISARDRDFTGRVRGHLKKTFVFLVD